MSDYVRKKCVRFKIPQNIIEELKDDSYLMEELLEKFQLKDDYNVKNDFTINYGEDFEKYFERE